MHRHDCPTPSTACSGCCCPGPHLHDPDQLKDGSRTWSSSLTRCTPSLACTMRSSCHHHAGDHIGTVEQWEHNRDILKEAITEMGQGLRDQQGDGAAGPSWTSTWPAPRAQQCGAIQLRLSSRARFGGVRGRGQREAPPIMIHRVVLNHRAVHRRHHRAALRPARFPRLAPVQVKCSPSPTGAAEYADQEMTTAKPWTAGLPVGPAATAKIGFIRQEPVGKATLYAGGAGDKGGRDPATWPSAQPPRRADRHELRRLCRQAGDEVNSKALGRTDLPRFDTPWADRYGSGHVPPARRSKILRTDPHLLEECTAAITQAAAIPSSRLLVAVPLASSSAVGVNAGALSARDTRASHRSPAAPSSERAGDGGCADRPPSGQVTRSSVSSSGSASCISFLIRTTNRYCFQIHARPVAQSPLGLSYRLFPYRDFMYC